MKLKNLIALGLIVAFVVGLTVSVNLIITQKAEAWVIPPGTIYNLALIACCDWYARNECPEDVRKLCFADCYEFGGCNTYPN